MATYAIGDVQGCYDELRALLQRTGFDAARDRLWLVGDLVNRGPKSLEVLRYVRSLGDRAATVLGNHDLHLVCRYEGIGRQRESDTFGDVLGAPDARELVGWLRTRQLMHVEGRYAMVHAGLLPQWTIERALALGREVEAALRPPRGGARPRVGSSAGRRGGAEARGPRDRVRPLVYAGPEAHRAARRARHRVRVGRRAHRAAAGGPGALPGTVQGGSGGRS